MSFNMGEKAGVLEIKQSHKYLLCIHSPSISMRPTFQFQATSDQKHSENTGTVAEIYCVVISTLAVSVLNMYRHLVLIIISSTI